MATVDPIELPSGVRHGTPEGHLAGCKGERANCPALAEHGMSCTYAYVRSTTTPDRYFKAKARNPEPREIARTLGFRPTTPEQALADVAAADAQLPAPRKPAPHRERTAPMPEPIIEPEPTNVDELPAPEPETIQTPTVDEPTEPPAPAPAPEYSSSDVRRWAKETGTDVPAHGPIPKHVAIAYELAHDIEHQAPAVIAASAPGKPEKLTLAAFTRGLTQRAAAERGAQIRDWLRHRNHDVADKGVIPSDLLRRYLDEHPDALTPAQPLAERSQDPSDDTPAPADEVAAATPDEAPAEGEDMGHPRQSEVQPTIGARAWLRHDDGVGIVRLTMAVDEGPVIKVRVSWFPDPRDEDGWKTYLNRISPWIDASEFHFDALPAGAMTPAELVQLEAGAQHVEATAELIDQVRDRIDMPRPEPIVDDLAVDRPEWADVAISEDVNRAIAERDQAIAELDRARSLAIALDQAHDAAIARAETAERALELALRSWDAALTKYVNLSRLHRRVYRAAAGWQRRAQQSEAALEQIRAAAQRGPGAAIAAILSVDGRPGIRITPPQPEPRRTWWRKNAR